MTEKRQRLSSSIQSESGGQLFCRLGLKQSIGGLDNTIFGDLPCTIQPKDVIELYGKEGSGKTQMLMHIIANCILPRTWQGVALNGRAVGVVYIDTDYHFALWRLIEILETRIHCCIDSLLNKVSLDDIQRFIKTCLSRLILVRCNSSFGLYATLESLNEILCNRPEVCVLMIDSISAFYWLDKNNATDSTYDQEKYQRNIAALISKYTDMYYLVVMVTKQALFHKHSKNQKEHYEYMCRAWQDLVKYRYAVDHDVNNRTLLLLKRIYPASRDQLTFSITKSGLSRNIRN